MGRKKLQIAWIANDSKRKSTLIKRKKSLMKKARELATLCSVENMCVIVFQPDQELPDVWPSVREAKDTLLLLQRIPMSVHNKTMIDQQRFMYQRDDKLVRQVRRVENDNAELETTLLMYQCLSGRSLMNASAADVGRLMRMLNINLTRVSNRLYSAGISHGDGIDRTMAMVPVPVPVPAEAEIQFTDGGGERWWNAEVGGSVGDGDGIDPPENRRGISPMKAAAVEMAMAAAWAELTRPMEMMKSTVENPQMHKERTVQVNVDKTPMEKPQRRKSAHATLMEYYRNMHNRRMAQARGKRPMEEAVAAINSRGTTGRRWRREMDPAHQHGSGP